MDRRNEAESWALLEAAPDAILGVTADGRIAVANAQAERLFGYRRDQLIGQPVDMLVPINVRDIHPSHRNRYLDDPKPRPMGAGKALVGRRRDGSEFPAEISLNAVRTDSGVMVAAAIRDVTDRKRAAEAVALLASIVQSSHDAIVGKSPEGIITSWNPGAERLYGYSAEEVIGQHVELLIPEARREEEAEILRRTLEGERIEQFQAGRRRKDGSLVAVSLTMSPIVDSGGHLVGVATVSRDISERQRADARFRAFLEAAPDAVVGVNAKGRIAMVNAQAERLFGYPRNELIGQRVDILVPDALRAVHPEHRAKYFADPKPRPMGAGMQLAARRRDGTEFPVDISLSAIETDEGLIVSAAVRDMTERIEAHAERERLRAEAERERSESQLHQSQRLESLGQLAGGVAHDFNNLLAVIQNYTSFVAEEVAKEIRVSPDGKWDAVQRDVEQIEKAATRATRLTHQLLAFGRREVVRPAVLNLNAVVTEVEQLLRRSLGEHVELQTHLAADLWPVLADPGQLEQVLVNLAVNARDAMPRGGSLAIETANEVVDADYAAAISPDLHTGRYVRLRVSDTGTGMIKEVADRAFDPFFTTKPKGEGSGLGLATTYGIVTQAGGFVRLYSEPGMGTTFNVMLPAADAAVADVHEPSSPHQERSSSGETVLVVEDEEAMREVTRRILARNGYRVITASTGAEAVALAQHHPGDIQLLLTDVVMPQMLGNEVAQQVLAIRPKTRVLYMSGYAHPVLAIQGTLEEGIALLEKPFSEDVILARVRAVLDGHDE